MTKVSHMCNDNYLAMYTKDPKRHYLCDLPEDFTNKIFNMLSPRAIFNLLSCNKKLFELCTKDSLWFNLASQRWRLQEFKPPKSYGAKSWIGVYRDFSLQKRLPRGPLTRKSCIVIAKGRSGGVDLWCTICHGPGCRTRAVRDFERNVSAVELRVIIQNVHNNLTYCDLNHIRVLSKPLNGGGLNHPKAIHAMMENFPIACLLKPPVISAINGILLEQENSSVLKLNPFDYAVLTLLVDARNCAYETDFIAKTFCLELPIVNMLDLSQHSLNPMHFCPCINKQQALSAAMRREHSIVRAFFIDENKIFDHYVQLPGGCVVLRESGMEGM